MPSPVIDPVESHPKVCREHIRRFPVAEMTRHAYLSRHIEDQVSGERPRCQSFIGHRPGFHRVGLNGNDYPFRPRFPQGGGFFKF